MSTPADDPTPHAANFLPEEPSLRQMGGIEDASKMNRYESATRLG